MYENGNSLFVIELTDQTFSMLLVANTISFYVVNFGGLLAMLMMVWRIRHTDDDTFLRQECVCLVSTWIGFSIIQYGITLINYYVQCEADNGGFDSASLFNFKQVSY